MDYTLVEEEIKRPGKPEIINSDQDSQFTCSTHFFSKSELTSAWMAKEKFTDSVSIERLWRKVKYNYV